MMINHNDHKKYYNTKVGEWLDCLFEVDDGEMVLVELKKEANEVAEMFVTRCEIVLEENGFDTIEFFEIVTAEQGEAMGLDTY